jgi:uncharacterized protein (TIGR00299 family) protein
VQIFTKLAEAEAKVHGTTVQKVHFHEVGAIDSIADIVGVAVGVDLLAADELICSPIPTGSGYVEIAHGRCSVPAPATAELLKGIPLAPSTVESELTTPTGAALVASLVTSFGPLPPMTIDTIGYGAGDRDFASQANVLRLLVGHRGAEHVQRDEILVLETNLDQATGEEIGHCSEQLLAAGALDVYATPILMKKGRPGTVLTVLCQGEHADTMERILFAETQTLGIRRMRMERHKLARESVEIATAWGPVRGKRVTLPDGQQRFAPEYEDCRRLAVQHGLPLHVVREGATGDGDGASASGAPGGKSGRP